MLGEVWVSEHLFPDQQITAGSPRPWSQARMIDWQRQPGNCSCGKQP